MTLDDAIAECSVVAIARGIRPDEVLAHAEAMYAAGLRAIEVPLNSPEPLESVAALSNAFSGRMVCGAGTVLRASQVDEVAARGGSIIVSPNSNPAVIRRAVELGLDPAPGFATPSEAFRALEAGARHLKLFPAVTYGERFVTQLRAVLPPEAIVWAVGGVGPAVMESWWQAGVRAFGLGGELYKAGQSIETTKEKARIAVEAIKSITG